MNILKKFWIKSRILLYKGYLNELNHEFNNQKIEFKTYAVTKRLFENRIYKLRKELQK
jgi:hypothetical protein